MTLTVSIDINALKTTNNIGEDGPRQSKSTASQNRFVVL